MKILSVYLGHNSTIAYLENGELKYFLHEEKFDNVKNSDNFPLKCIEYLKSKEDISNLDKIVVIGKWINRRMLRYIKNYTKDNKCKIINYKIGFRDRVLYFLMKYFPRFMNRVNDSYLWIRKQLYTKKVISLIEYWLWQKIIKDQIEFVSHHESHALSVIYFYWLHLKQEPILVFTLDWGWDRHCATVNIWDNNTLETIGTVRNRYSLWDIWSKSFTWGLGMSPLEHEYKVMWLAAYSSKKYYQEVYDKLFKNTIKLKWLTWKSKIPWNQSHVYYHNKLWWLRFDNIAWALQEFTEETVIQWIKNAVEKTGIKKIAVAGWVFMNVKLNQKLQEQNFLEKIYFMPSAWDDSTPIWWVFSWYIHAWGNIKHLKPVETMFLWVRYTNKEVEEFMKDKTEKYIIEKFNNENELIDATVNLLKNYEIVSIFQWPWEWWARSLCNRAILANASDLQSFHTVNDMIKMRDFWMPFAPTILEEQAGKYIKHRDILKNKILESSHYMITAFDGTDLAIKDLRAAMHQKDKTLRPQLVNKHSNPMMYEILKKYEIATWMWGLMNTSLNIHGYPLVWTLEQAIFTLENSWLKHMIINNVLIHKK